MTGPYIASLVTKRPASGDGLCRVDKTVSPRRRSRVSPSSTFADFENCGAGATRRRRRHGSAVSADAGCPYRMRELASGGLRPELRRQMLHHIALELQQTRTGYDTAPPLG